MIHKTAIIDPKAKISSKVEIGPYCVIGPNVEIDDDVTLQSNVYIQGRTKIGKKKRKKTEHPPWQICPWHGRQSASGGPVPLTEATGSCK